MCDTARMRLALVALFFCGCAASVAEYRTKYCNYDGAFTRGSDDAENMRKVSEAWITYCTPEQKQHAENGYRSGYNTTAGSYLGRVHP